MKNEIIMASGNEGKIKEAQGILKEYTIIPMKKLGIEIDVEEDQKTFIGNAKKKAKVIAQELDGKMCIADDSGIEIEYLDGFPGVYTKRWHEGTDRERNLAIIEKLKDVPKERRKMKFVTAIAISNGNTTISSIAQIDGYVAENVRGDNGFGFDEIFELENGKTLAELTQEEKNEISARRKALENLKNKLNVTKKIDKELVEYIENEIFPLYSKNEKGHGMDHIDIVIERSIKLAKDYDVDINMVYTIASYHDLGHHIDRKTHEIISAKIFMEDTKIIKWFNDDQRKIIKEAIEDHRASSNHEPRSIYGKIISTADRVIVDIDNSIKRSYLYGVEHYQNISYEQQIERVYQHLKEKYGEKGLEK